MSARIPQMYAPRRPTQPQHSPTGDPFADDEPRNSTNLSSIGGLFLDSDSDPPTPKEKPRLGRERSNTITAHANDHHARSMKGLVEDTEANDAQASPRPRVRTPISVIFPQPSPATPPPQLLNSPNMGQQPIFTQPHPAGATPLPIFQGPVSPLLAAPPRAHFSPGEPSSPQQSDNASIRGFNSMQEKHATFREGDHGIITPFSPGARRAGPRTRAPGPGRSGLSGRRSVYSTVDFWKRFSHVARGSDEKESQWMKERKRSIWRNPLFVVPFGVVVLALAAIIVYLVIKDRV